MVLLIMRKESPGTFAAVDIDPEDIDELRESCRLIVDVKGGDIRSPMRVIHDLRRQGCPYVPDHKLLEDWVRAFANLLLTQ